MVGSAEVVDDVAFGVGILEVVPDEDITGVWAAAGKEDVIPDVGDAEVMAEVGKLEVMPDEGNADVVEDEDTVDVVADTGNADVIACTDGACVGCAVVGVGGLEKKSSFDSAAREGCGTTSSVGGEDTSGEAETNGDENVGSVDVSMLSGGEFGSEAFGASAGDVELLVLVLGALDAEGVGVADVTRSRTEIVIWAAPKRIGCSASSSTREPLPNKTASPGKSSMSWRWPSRLMKRAR